MCRCLQWFGFRQPVPSARADVNSPPLMSALSWVSSALADVNCLPSMSAASQAKTETGENCPKIENGPWPQNGEKTKMGFGIFFFCSAILPQFRAVGRFYFSAKFFPVFSFRPGPFFHVIPCGLTRNSCL